MRPEKRNGTTHCSSCPVRPYTICNYFRGSYFNLLAKHKIRDEIYSRGQVVIVPNENNDYIFFQIDGWSKSFSCSDNGSHQIIDVNFPGALLGYTHIPATPHQFGVQAIAETRFCLFPKRKFHDLIRRDPELMSPVLFWLEQERNRALGRVQVLSQRSARQRMATVLLDLYDRAVRTPLVPANLELHIPLTQDDLGDLVSITTVRANQILREFEREGVLDYGRAYYAFRDIETLRYIAQGHALAKSGVKTKASARFPTPALSPSRRSPSAFSLPPSSTSQGLPAPHGSGRGPD